MPSAPTMVMLYGKGGHLATDEYSIIVVRHADGSWQGTAAGRSQVGIVGAAFTPMKRMEWQLGSEEGRQLYDAISHLCPRKPAAKRSTPSGPPSLSFIPERIDVVTPNKAMVTFDATEDDGKIAKMIRPAK